MRCLWVLALTTPLLAACAGEQRPTSGYGLTGSVAAAPTTSDADAIEKAAEARLVARRSMASKVLAGIALERVTGRKPDPMRFADAR